MHLFLTMILIGSVLSASCGRSKKEPIVGPVTKNDAPATALIEAPVTTIGLTTDDAKQSWLVWTLICGNEEFAGVASADQKNIKFAVPKIAENSLCEVRVTGEVPLELKPFYISPNGVLYQAAPFKITTSSQMITLTKLYDGPGAAGIATQQGTDLEVATTTGTKCKEYDTTTFECIP